MLDRLRLEVAQLRRSQKRLVLAADADRRSIERELHEGLQQRLVALAVDLQAATSLADADPAAKALLEEMGRDVQEALDEAAKLAQRIYPPLLEAGGLAAALRAAAVSAGISASVEVEAGSTYPPELARTVYFCWLEALENVGGAGHITITMQEEDLALAFEIVEDTAGSANAADRSGGDFARFRDRVEALGGWLTIRPEPGLGTRVSGSLPLSR
jgi:signal transduction histidine kinase